MAAKKPRQKTEWRKVTATQPMADTRVIARVEYPTFGDDEPYAIADPAERYLTPQGLVWVDERGQVTEAGGARVTGWLPWPEV